MNLETIVELCEVNEVHDATLNQIKAKMPKEETLYDLSSIRNVPVPEAR